MTVDIQKCRHLKMEMALRLLCRVVPVHPSGYAIARWFERMMDNPELSENNKRWADALEGRDYSEVHLCALANHVPAVQKFLDHPFWIVMDMVADDDRTNTLLLQYFPDVVAVKRSHQLQQLSSYDDLDRLTALLLLNMPFGDDGIGRSWPWVTVGAVASGICRLCAQNLWFPVRFVLADLVHHWLSDIQGNYFDDRWFESAGALEDEVKVWGSLHDLSWATELVHNEHDWRAFCFVFLHADNCRRKRIMEALDWLDDTPGSIFDFPDLLWAYRRRCLVMRSWSAKCIAGVV